MDVRGLSGVTDYYVVASGLNPPHLKALERELDRALAAEGVRRYRRSGSPESQWIVTDFLDVVVHLFTPEMRNYYDLERLWIDAPRVGEMGNG